MSTVALAPLLSLGRMIVREWGSYGWARPQRRLQLTFASGNARLLRLLRRPSPTGLIAELRNRQRSISRWCGLDVMFECGGTDVRQAQTGKD